MSHKREFVYWFNEEAGSEEIERDVSRVLPVPKKGAFVHRKDKEWQVTKVIFEVLSDNDLTLIVNIYLTDQYSIS